MKDFIKIPETTKEANAENTHITGLVSAVSAQQGLNTIRVTGGQNPGQYAISSKVTDGLQVALTALNNQSTIWG